MQLNLSSSILDFAGSQVFDANATDSDTGLQGQLEYSITGGLNRGIDFTVDLHTGRVYVGAELDRETRGLYVLNLTVKDRALIEGDRRSTVMKVGVKELTLALKSSKEKTTRELVGFLSSFFLSLFSVIVYSNYLNKSLLLEAGDIFNWSKHYVQSVNPIESGKNRFWEHSNETQYCNVYCFVILVNIFL